MTRNRKIFIVAFIIFAIIMAIIAYDIAMRTTFPGKKTPADSTAIEQEKRRL